METCYINCSFEFISVYQLEWSNVILVQVSVNQVLNIPNEQVEEEFQRTAAAGHAAVKACIEQCWVSEYVVLGVAQAVKLVDELRLYGLMLTEA